MSKLRMSHSAATAPRADRHQIVGHTDRVVACSSAAAGPPEDRITRRKWLISGERESHYKIPCLNK